MLQRSFPPHFHIAVYVKPNVMDFHSSHRPFREQRRPVLDHHEGRGMQVSGVGDEEATSIRCDIEADRRSGKSKLTRREVYLKEFARGAWVSAPVDGRRSNPVLRSEKV